MTYVIEKGVPVPPHAPGRSRSDLSGALVLMDAGDSVFVPDGDKAKIANVAARLAKAKSRSGWKFVTLEVLGGIRIWRVS